MQRKQMRGKDTKPLDTHAPPSRADRLPTKAATALRAYSMLWEELGARESKRPLPRPAAGLPPAADTAEDDDGQHAPSGLGALTSELLLHVLKQALPGKTLAAMECVSHLFAGRHHTDAVDVASAEAAEARVSLPEKAARICLQEMYPDVSFRPSRGESWKQLLARVDVFRAEQPEPKDEKERAEARLGLLSAEFENLFGGHFYHGWSAPDASSAPPDGVIQWLEQTAAMGCAASQYALGCHYAAGRHEHSGVHFDPHNAEGLGRRDWFAQRARSLFESAAAQKFKAARGALKQMDRTQGKRPRVSDFLYRDAYGTYNPLLKKWLHDPEVEMTAAEVGELSAPFRDMAFASPRDEWDYPDRNYALPDGAEELRQADNVMDKLFVRAVASEAPGVWPATGVTEDDYGEDTPMLSAVRRMTDKEGSVIAFIGNGIAFHPGVWNDNCPSTSDVEGLSTHPDIVCYECRSPRGVFTLQELVDATRAVVWLNGHNHEQHNDLSSIRRIPLDHANDFTDTVDGGVKSDGIGGAIHAAEFERLNQEMERFTGTNRHRKMCTQNAFAVVGAGPHRFTLGFDS